MPPLHVCFLHGSNDLYGASRVLLDDVTLLARQGVRVSVCLPGPGPLDAPLTESGADVTHPALHVLRRVSGPRALRLPLSLPAMAKAADVVVCWTLATIAYAPAARARRKRVVCSVHELLPGRAGSLLVAFAAICATDVIANSSAVAAWIQETGRASVAPLVMYPAAPAYAPMPKPSGDTVTLLMAGRVNGKKGHIEAVDAVAQARATTGMDLQLELYGAAYPGQEPFMEALQARTRVEEWAHLRGEVGSIADALSASDAVLMPSTVPEPFGIVALEAWAAGRRVIGSDEGGLAEAVRLADGLPVPPRDIGAFADAISSLVARGKLDGPSPNAPARHRCTLAMRDDAWKELLSG